MRRIILMLILLPVLVLFAQKKEKISSWKELFPDHLERVCVFMKDKDKTVFRFTSHYEKMVHLNAGSMKEDLKKYGYKIEDIEVVIHNHFTDCKFSDADYRQYSILKSYGFNGRFLLYCHRTKKTYNIEKNNKSYKNAVIDLILARYFT